MGHDTRRWQFVITLLRSLAAGNDRASLKRNNVTSAPEKAKLLLITQDSLPKKENLV